MRLGLRLACAVPLLVMVLGCGGTQSPDTATVSDQPKPRPLDVIKHNGPERLELTQPIPNARIKPGEPFDVSGTALVPNPELIAFPGQEVITELRTSRGAMAGNTQIGLEKPSKGAPRPFRGQVTAPRKPGRYTFKATMTVFQTKVDSADKQVIDTTRWGEVTTEPISLDVRDEP